MPTTTVKARNSKEARRKAIRKVGKKNTVTRVALTGKAKRRRKGPKAFAVTFRRRKKGGRK